LVGTYEGVWAIALVVIQRIIIVKIFFIRISYLVRQGNLVYYLGHIN
jgi:hypothetical protein